MSNYDKNYLREKINKLRLKNCENILVGDVLYYAIEITSMRMVRACCRIIRSNFMENYYYMIDGVPDKIMFYSNSYRSRGDHLAAFDKVCSTTGNYIKIIPGTYKKRRNLHTLKLACEWIFTLKKSGIDLRLSVCLTSILHSAYCDFLRVSEYTKKYSFTIKHALAVCDVMPIDSFFVQKWNREGINTITLQHGYYGAGSYAYKLSKSNIFLAHNRISAINAKKSGIEEKRVFIVGAPQNINAVRKHKDSIHVKNIIGLLLGGIEGELYDLEMIGFVKRFAQKYNYRIFLKLHPGVGIKQYKTDIRTGIDRIFESEVSVYQFADMVEVTMDAGSTVFFEYMIQGRISLTYMCDISPYRNDANIKLGFSTYEEMEQLLLLIQNNRNLLEKLVSHNKQYLGTEKDPYEHYRDFFKDLKEIPQYVQK